jgi:predicted secreted Zn-dependent protease
MPFAARYVRIPLLFFLFCGMSGVADAEVVARKSFSYFDIKGNTADELDAALNARGPTIGASSRHPGATRIRFGGAATYIENNGRCSIGGARVTVSIEIILPRWRDRRHASRQLSMVWDALAADIKRHEQRHAEIARDSARAMEKRLLQLPSAVNCDVLQERVNDESTREISRHDADQAHFDVIEAANFQDRMQRLLKYHNPPKNAKN